MRKKLIVTSLVVASCLAFNLAAKGADAPKVISLSNTSTENRDAFLLVKPGENITFTVKAEGSQRYEWKIDTMTRTEAMGRNWNHLPGKYKWREFEIQKGAKGDSFTWRVPGKGIWKIRVRAINSACEDRTNELIADCARCWKKDKSEEWSRWLAEALVPSGARAEWIVATSVVEVKPGRSIQKAIDSLAPEGGIVRLLPGRHVVRDTIFIKRSNIAVVGTHSANVVHDTKKTARYKAESCFRIPPGGYHDITFKGFSTTSTYKHSYCGIFSATQVTNFTVSDIHDTSYASSLAGAGEVRGTYRMSNRNIYFLNNRTNHRAGMGTRFAENVHFVNNNITGSNGVDLNRGNIFSFVCSNYANGTGNFGLRGHGGVYTLLYDNVFSGRDAGIYNDGLSHMLATNNLIEKTKYGIWICPQAPRKNLLYRNNIIRNCRQGVYTSHYSHAFKPEISDAAIINNVIYNCTGDGVGMTSPWVKLDIRNNIISNNGGFGINCVKTKEPVVIRNNNIWRNAKGNYNECAVGPGDFYKDPLFADPSNGGFHLKSKAGRWGPKAKKWVKDAAHSPCIDAGDSKADFSKEPAPNGGRINIGAYGNTKEASKSGREKKKAQPSVKLWDVGEKHPWHNGFRPYAKQQLWKQVPYGQIGHEFKGDAVIENEFFYLYFYRTITLHGKVDGKPRIWRNVLYKVYVDPDGRRNYGHSQPKYFKIIKNTPQEIIVEHQGGKSVTTTYRFPRNKPWFEVRGVKNATELGIHGKVRMALAPVEGGNDFVVDSLRDPPGRPKAPSGKMIICFYENITNPCMWVFTWTVPFKEAAPWFLNDSGPKGDTMWCSPGKWGGLTIPRSWPGCITSSWAKFGRSGGVVLGALVYPNNWYRRQVNKPITKGQTYKCNWKPPYPGRWRMTVRIAEKKYDQGFKYDGRTKFPAKYYSRDVLDGKFTFKSPADGWVDYVIMYMYDRTKQTPAEILTPMDQYRWTMKNK